MYPKGRVQVILLKKAGWGITLFKYLLRNNNVSVRCRTLGMRYKNDPNKDSIPPNHYGLIVKAIQIYVPQRQKVKCHEGMQIELLGIYRGEEIIFS